VDGRAKPGHEDRWPTPAATTQPYVNFRVVKPPVGMSSLKQR
jgi:hypothetical protein